MRFKALEKLSRPVPLEIPLQSLPTEILITDYAKAKALLLDQLVRELHGEAVEWYAFTLGEKRRPEVIVEVGLPENAENLETYTSITPEAISAFQETLPPELVINGWLHSHGRLDYRRFSELDELNQVTVLDFVSTRLRIPVAKKEVVIRDLGFLHLKELDRNPSLESLAPDTLDSLSRDSVTLLTEVPVRRARLLETLYGGFCFAIVLGGEGWFSQEIHYQIRGVLTGETRVSKRVAELRVVPDSRTLSTSDQELLAQEVKSKIKPQTRTLEKLERG